MWPFTKDDKTKSQVYQQAPLMCPRCKIIMGKLRKHDVTIDVCRRCKGMWLDKGEMGKLLELGSATHHIHNDPNKKDNSSNKKGRRK